MSGKSYSMREMKSIVEYLTENKFYNETRGRKMWMDFANSALTTRTWQSLKETFLKRILPDITNPYYKLNPDQILSFKRGLNLTQTDKKLKIEPVNKSIHKDANGDNVQPSTSKNNNEDNATGEDSQCSKIVHDRASTETLILDTCYQTAEDIQKDLESTDEEQDREIAKKKPKCTVKSVRDFIEYSEPLTPMLQEVLDDFATDEDCSDTEPPMQIDETYVVQDEISNGPENAASSQSILNPNKTDKQDIDTKIGEKDNSEEIRNEKQVTEHSEESVKHTNEPFSQLEDVMVLVDEALTKHLDERLNTENVKSQVKEANSHELSSAITDSLLPNNQEAIQNTSTVEVHSPVLPTPHVNSHQGNEKEDHLHINLSNAKDNLISDEEDKLLNNTSSDNPIEIDSNEEKTENVPEPNTNMTLVPNQHTTENSNSPKKPDSNDDEVHDINSDSSTGNKEATSQVDNPCLKSVSLYAEELITTKYSDSDTNNKEDSNDQPKANENNDETKENEDQKNIEQNPIAETSDNVILLNSRSNSESVDDSVSDRPLARASLKRQKDKKLASIFGISNGGAKSRRLVTRKRTISHRSLQSNSSSSEWTSTSDSEFVSPPHGRRNRYARKYLKPNSARIMSLDKEGGLFVMLGKKIYPLVKDGKLVKNYVTYLPESDPEEDDSYWKSKYIDERKRTDELKKKLGKVKSNGALDKEGKESSVPLSSPLTEDPPRLPPSRQQSINSNELMRRDSETLEKSSNHETLKIKFTKHDQEVQLEGHWQHINPVLAQVVSMFHKEPVESKQTETATCLELSSGNTTPLVNTVPPRYSGMYEKINEIESEIFKEIEEKDTHEMVVEQKEEQENNIPVENTVEEIVKDNLEKEPQFTQRKKRGRPKKETSPAVAATQIPTKKRKSSTKPTTSNLEVVKEQEIKEITPNVTRQTRTPRKLLDGIASEAKATRRTTTKVQPETAVEIPKTPVTEEPDDEVRYKFPSPVPENGPTSINAKRNKGSPKKHLRNIEPPDCLSHDSVNSSQGYQDSDTSPFHIGIRRKRRLSVSTLSIRGRKIQRKQRSRSYPLLNHMNSESSNSSFNISVKSIRREQSTIRSEVYKSDSYQLLMPRTRAIMQRLERIEEANYNETDNLMNRIRNLCDEISEAVDNATNKNDAASSSNLSLPLSPELSIVENLSISKSAIAAVDDPTINEIQSNTALTTSHNKYLISDVDVSMPLMAQDCALQESYKKHLMCALSNLSDAPNSAGRNLSNDSSMKVSITSESILKSVSNVNIESDSLDKRLEQLLLDSTQKPAIQRGVEKMEVDTEVKKKSGSRKRCSTPHKKNTVINKRKSNEEPIVEEESKARCSRGGRRSCPPSVDIVYYEGNAPDNVQIDIQDESINVTTVMKTKRVKKDIIKVKIVRPKDKAPKNKKPKKKTQDVSQSSGNTECDNESGVFLQGLEDSGDLIHNHSETCLQIGDCMGDSIEFIETGTKSIISLNSSSSTTEQNKENLDRNSMGSGKTTPELFCDNAQCAVHLCDARTTEAKSVDSGNTVYFTPFATQCNSILTEDLSDEAPVSKSSNFRPSKWYLLSDEESNTTYCDVQESAPPIYGANLQQLFPITCAVPDLSTITEMSEKNDNSNKTSLDAEN